MRKFYPTYYTCFTLFLFCQSFFAQNNSPVYNQAKEITFHANVANLDSSVRAEVYYEPNKKIKIDLKNTYYWFYINKISFTQGGFDGRLLHGDYISFYPNNAIKEKGIFKDGMKSGQWVAWYKTGKIKEVSNWDKSHKHGVNEFYDKDGNLTLKLNYKHGRLDGEYIEYQDGKQTVVKKYKNGQELHPKIKSDTLSFGKKVKKFFTFKKKKDNPEKINSKDNVKNDPAVPKDNPKNSTNTSDKEKKSKKQKKDKKENLAKQDGLEPATEKKKKEGKEKKDNAEPAKEKKKPKKERKAEEKAKKDKEATSMQVPETKK